MFALSSVLSLFCPRGCSSECSVLTDFVQLVMLCYKAEPPSLLWLLSIAVAAVGSDAAMLSLWLRWCFALVEKWRPEDQNQAAELNFHPVCCKMIEETKSIENLVIPSYLQKPVNQKAGIGSHWIIGLIHWTCRTLTPGHSIDEIMFPIMRGCIFRSYTELHGVTWPCKFDTALVRLHLSNALKPKLTQKLLPIPFQSLLLHHVGKAS